jgi:CheY-like chemotaxis protein
LEKANQQTISKITQEFPDSDQWLQKRQESLQITSPLISAGFPSMKQSTSRTASATAWLQRRRDSLPANSLFGSIPVAIPSKLSSEMGSSSLRSNSFDNLSSSIENLLDFNPSHSSSIGLKNSFHSLDDSNPSLEDLNASNAQYSERNSSKDVSQSLEKDALELKKDSQAYLDSAKQSIFRKSKDAFDSKKYQEFDSEPGWLSEKPLDVLIAEANPVGSKILETILQNLNCRCIKVKNGDEAAQTLMGDIKFDIVFTDVNISIGIFDFILVNAEALVKMIKNTSNLNFQTPIVAITTSSSPITTKNEFDYVITKPVTKTSILDTLVALNLPIDDTFE